MNRERISALILKSLDPQFEGILKFCQQASSVHVWSTITISAEPAK